MASNFILYVIYLTFSCVTLTSSKPSDYYDIDVPLQIINRSTWGARSPNGNLEELETPVPYVVIHHSSVPAACYDQVACSQAMRSMQYVHQSTNGWIDIGYNFAIGSDGLAYEGRGWDVIGAHAPSFNNVSIGIVLIGHWVSELPPLIQLEATKQLIELGIDLGYINPEYALIGHRQVRATECPGEVLFRHIAEWEHFDGSLVFGQSYQLHILPALGVACRRAHGEKATVHTCPIRGHPPHTYIPPACDNFDECSKDMRSMQKYHMGQLGWEDIGYNFCVGADGAVYEGRGWQTLGIHAGPANSYSVGICLIGDWRVELPPKSTLETTKALIESGVERGFISPDYKLIGHSQVMDTECPGKVLLDHISTWEHYAPGHAMFTKRTLKS